MVIKIEDLAPSPVEIRRTALECNNRLVAKAAADTVTLGDVKEHIEAMRAIYSEILGARCQLILKCGANFLADTAERM